jgi:type II secretory pathway pseudopilin PulG
LARRSPRTGKSGKSGKPAGRPRENRARGFSTLEVLLSAAMLLTVGGIAVPSLRYATDCLRAAAAARYVATRLQRARMESVTRSADVAVRFAATSSGYSFAVYVDGNRNGVLASDIAQGVDWRLGPVESLPENFAGVDFGTLPGLPAIEIGGTAPGTDPIHLGSSGSATFAPLGTSSTGTLYVKGHGNQQFAIRIYGETGKTRIMKFDMRSRRWNPL